ncbi:hypothetical protein KY349_00350 [Candidatus Woesearchaeota archaeon]|nr:hypothetical protein [Candidatus Woesearchaeota archaeon]
MGLMIVVILLIVGVLFAIKFVVLKKPPETRQSFSRTQMASNLGLALMASTTENCRGTAVKDLLIDCAEWPEAGGTITCGDGRKSCEYVSSTIELILADTLDIWNQKYYLTAGTEKTLEGKIVYLHHDDCPASKTLPGESESFFLPTNRGLLTLKIFICV